MPRVVHFEICADDPERASKFYTDVFGWQINKWDGPVDYWLTATGSREQPGIDGGIMRRESPTMPGVINTIDVASVDAMVEQIVAHGGSVAMPKTSVPGMGYIAYCLDTEGNMFSIMEEDLSAV
ncbi:VOC family protein [Candidatus Chloroploca asiatica]|uniref:Glyoxalase n=1 Tax=Candidatus Chloroploca asiatica TaxID=1506545 RepID=A0A2H3L526_9CHLR|nr:VOC family protein [Candidatus Chloroploca asiatica]PDV98291.1 glyoxalase [Candidatus Chloroploca asiatica]